MYYRKARIVNSTLTTLPSQVPTITAPVDLVEDATSNSAFNVRQMQVFRKRLAIIPFGTATNTQTFQVNVIGWGLIGSLWVPTLISNLQGVFSSTFFGVASTPVLAGMLFCGEAITIIGDVTVTKALNGGTNSGISGVVIDCSQLPFDWYQLDCSANNSSTDVNCLIGAY